MALTGGYLVLTEDQERLIEYIVCLFVCLVS